MSNYTHYTVGGSYGDDTPIVSETISTWPRALEFARYTKRITAAVCFPVIYGWVDDDPANAVELEDTGERIDWQQLNK